MPPEPPRRPQKRQSPQSNTRPSREPLKRAALFLCFILPKRPPRSTDAPAYAPHGSIPYQETAPPRARSHDSGLWASPALLSMHAPVPPIPVTGSVSAKMPASFSQNQPGRYRISGKALPRHFRTHPAYAARDTAAILADKAIPAPFPATFSSRAAADTNGNSGTASPRTCLITAASFTPGVLTK